MAMPPACILQTGLADNSGCACIFAIGNGWLGVCVTTRASSRGLITHLAMNFQRHFICIVALILRVYIYAAALSQLQAGLSNVKCLQHMTAAADFANGSACMSGAHYFLYL